MCLKVCSSVMSLSISCTEVAVARCSTELMLLATISLSFSGWRSRLVTTSRRTNSRISASTFVSAGWSCSTVSRGLRSAMFDPPVYGAPDEHGNVTAWGPLIEYRKCGKDQGPRALLSVYPGTGSLAAVMKEALRTTLILVVWIVFWLGGAFGGAVLQARLIDIGVVSDTDPPWIIRIGPSFIGFFAGAYANQT